MWEIHGEGCAACSAIHAAQVLHVRISGKVVVSAVLSVDRYRKSVENIEEDGGDFIPSN